MSLPVRLTQLIMFVYLQYIAANTQLKISCRAARPAFMLALPIIVTDGLKTNFHGLCANSNPVVGRESLL